MYRPTHPNHNQAANIMENAVITAPNEFGAAFNNHFANLPQGHRHRVVKLFAKKYIDNIHMQDSLAAISHRDKDYKAAADSLEKANGEFGALHHMLAYNMGVEHPLVAKAAEVVNSRNDMTSAYRRTLDLHSDDINSRFGDIINNMNLGQQFKPKED